MPFADVNGQRIAYEETAPVGPAVVLAHGFLMDRTMFAPQVQALREEFRVITWDERGFGETEWDGKPFSYYDLASDCLGLLDHLGIEQAVVGGMSQGGFLSLRVALTAPERVKALVLIDTQAGVDPEETTAGYRAMEDEWLDKGPHDALAGAVASIILGPEFDAAPWIDKWRAAPKDALAQPFECLVGRDDVTARLPEIEAPALVIHGTDDAAIPMERAEQLCEGLANCVQLVRVEGGTHAANLTHPEAVNQVLLDFLRQHA